SGISFEVQACQKEDIDNRKGELFERDNDVYSKLKNLHDEFQSMWMNDREQLSQYNSISYMDNNTELNDKNLAMQDYKNSAESIHSDVVNHLNKLDTMDNQNERYEMVISVDKLIEQEENIYSQMQDIRKEVTESLLQIINDRRAVFEEQKRREEEERKKQAEIDAQNLLINNNPNPTTEISIGNTENESAVSGQVANENMEKQNVNLQEKQQNDLTAPKKGGKIITKYDKNKREELPKNKPIGGLLTPVEGAVQKVSGSIKVQ
ncbi:MAG: hypothetical protein IJ677_03150, partial [Alphaproteobacteria bacterium]|nr:hypothetical protein [Alphaproteobacteria bacterium]